MNLKSDATVSPESHGEIHRFRHEAMATYFEILLVEPDVSYARQASQAAFERLDELERELSRFIEGSDIHRINNSQPGTDIPISLDTYTCLEECIEIAGSTEGAFDITIGALQKQIAEGQIENFDESLEAALENTGSTWLELDRKQCRVHRNKPLLLDLGGYGKGYAVDAMAAILEDWELNCALIHGGHSSVRALDPPPGQSGWPVAIKSPNTQIVPHKSLDLANIAWGASGLNEIPHIIHPHTGQPVTDKTAVWCRTSRAATADALSTAFMVMSVDDIERYCRLHNDIEAILIVDDEIITLK